MGWLDFFTWKEGDGNSGMVGAPLLGKVMWFWVRITDFWGQGEKRPVQSTKERKCMALWGTQSRWSIQDVPRPETSWPIPWSLPGLGDLPAAPLPCVCCTGTLVRKRHVIIRHAAQTAYRCRMTDSLRKTVLPRCSWGVQLWSCEPHPSNSGLYRRIFL